MTCGQHSTALQQAVDEAPKPLRLSLLSMVWTKQSVTAKLAGHEVENSMHAVAQACCRILKPIAQSPVLTGGASFLYQTLACCGRSMLQNTQHHKA
eukprot:1150997-Pelagomonas_calceolata.AAC.1